MSIEPAQVRKAKPYIVSFYLYSKIKNKEETAEYIEKQFTWLPYISK